MGRIALERYFSLDVLCDKISSLLVVNYHVSVRNWPPLLLLHVVTESANDSALEAEIRTRNFECTGRRQDAVRYGWVAMEFHQSLLGHL